MLLDKAIHSGILVTFTISHYIYWIFETCGSGSISTDSSLLLFTQYKTRCLTIISSHCLAASPAKEVNSHMQKNTINYRNLKWTFADLLPCYFDATKKSSRTLCSQVSQHESAGEGVDMSELQAYHSITPEQWSWLLCNVSVIPINEV